MKKNIFIMIFASVISILSISSVKALNNPYVDSDFYFPVTDDYTGCSNGTENTCLAVTIEDKWSGYYKWQCWYTTGTTNYGSGSQLYCFVTTQGWDPYLYWNNGNYVNTFNDAGFAIAGASWINYSNKNSYGSSAILKWNSDSATWSHICEAYGTNACNYNIITANGDQFPTSIYSDNLSIYATPYFKTDIWYSYDQWQSPFFQALSFKPRDTVIKRLYIFNHAPTGSPYDLLDVVLYTDSEALYGTVAGTLYYSYDNSNWYNAGEKEWGDNFRLYVYSNETVYFKVVDSNNNVILTNSFTVTGKVTFNGYQVINIPSGNHNIYISNFSNSSGSFYIPPDYKVFTDEFVYLDSSGNKVGYQYINTSNYDNIGVDTISGDSYFMLKVPYDYSSFTNVNTLMFNVNSQYDLTLYIPTGLYIDFVDLNNKNNYECDSSSDISSGTNLSSCELEYDQMVNNSLVSGTDSTTTKFVEENDDVNDSNNFSITFKNMFLQFSKPFYVIGNLYTNFIGVVPVPIMYSIYLGFGLLILCIFIKIWL